MGADEPFSLNDPRMGLRVNSNPLQRAGLPELVRESAFPEPGHRRDIRMYLDQSALETLLSRAKASMTGRAVLHQVSLRVRLFRGKDGRTYEAWSIEADRPPEAENPAILMPMGEGSGKLSLT